MVKVVTLGSIILLLILSVQAQGASMYKGHTAKYWAKATRGQVQEKRQTQRALHKVKKQNKKLRRTLRSVVVVSNLDHPLERNFLCIYGGENGGHGWTANTGNGYYGGLQMDREFQLTYGRIFYKNWGTADKWPVSVQLTVSMIAYLSGRGFYPWPNTARNCGLI